MKIEGEWTIGDARLLKEISKAVKKREEIGVDLSIDNKGLPDLLVMNMNTGHSVRVKGDVLRKADHTQRIRHKRPPKVVEALLMEVLEYSLEGKDAAVKQKFWKDLREWLAQAKVGEIWKKWERKHEQRIKAIESMLDEHLEQTLTKCTGQTFIKSEIVSQEQRAVLERAPNLFAEVEGWDEPEIAEQMEEEEYEPDQTIE